MNQNYNEEGETRLGCFSDSGDENTYGVDVPICPKCGSRDYQLLDDSTAYKCHCNCRCSNCGANFNYYFNK